jgi:hypothetical protein
VWVVLGMESCTFPQITWSWSYWRWSWDLFIHLINSLILQAYIRHLLCYDIVINAGDIAGNREVLCFHSWLMCVVGTIWWWGCGLSLNTSNHFTDVVGLLLATEGQIHMALMYVCKIWSASAFISLLFNPEIYHPRSKRKTMVSWFG